MTITLYYAPFTRATRPRWLLEELGVPYELKVVDLKGGENKSKDYTDTVHPHGSVPAMRIDGEVMIESGAIITLLADRYPEKGLAPAIDHRDRAKYLQWLFYTYATIEPAVVAVASHNPTSAYWYGAPLPEREARDRARMKEVVDVVEAGVSRSDWLLPTFSAADVLVGSVMLWAASMKLCEDRPALAAWFARCRERPAFQRARK
ncbi:MAG: glutathione S-transferase family protein [Deltaproteobacteria bacterium]|nr:glutathione S-transferase family protein [Deltaproteobacteria bacterium]